MSASINPDNPVKRSADVRTRSMEILDSNPGMSAQQAQLQARKELSQKSNSEAPQPEQKEQTDGAPAGNFSNESNNSAIAANTPGSMNTGTGGQKTDIESNEIEGSSNPLTNLYAAINNLKDRSISFIPKAGQELKAVVLHVESVTNEDPAIRTTAGGSNTELGTNKGNEKSALRWYKCYCIVDFYTSCLPLPTVAPYTEKELNDPIKAKEGRSYPDELSMMRVSRFPYFLGRVDKVPPPQIGQLINVKYLDDDNFSYGVYLGAVKDMQEAKTTNKDKDKASTENVANPKPLIEAPSEDVGVDQTAADRTTSTPASEENNATENAPEPASGESSPPAEDGDSTPGPWAPAANKEIGLSNLKSQRSDLEGRIARAAAKIANPNTSEGTRERNVQKKRQFENQLVSINQKISEIENHG